MCMNPKCIVPTWTFNRCPSINCLDCPVLRLPNASLFHNNPDAGEIHLLFIRKLFATDRDTSSKAKNMYIQVTLDKNPPSVQRRVLIECEKWIRNVHFVGIYSVDSSISILIDHDLVFSVNNFK